MSAEEGSVPSRGRSIPSTGRSVSLLSETVRIRRKALGLRQAELADLAGCSERFVHTVENGKASLRLDKLLDVLRVLGLDLAVVLGQGGGGGKGIPTSVGGGDQ